MNNNWKKLEGFYNQGSGTKVAIYNQEPGTKVAMHELDE